MNETTGYNGPKPRLGGFLSNHISPEKVVSITPEPDTVYIEEARDENRLNSYRQEAGHQVHQSCGV